MQHQILTPRPLGRAGRTIAPILWKLQTEVPPSEVLQAAREAAANWFLAASSMHVATLEEHAEAIRAISSDHANWVLEVTTDSIAPRSNRVIHERLAALGAKKCAAIMLDDPSPGEVKAGGPFHRLSQLRDSGLIDLFFLDIHSYEVAEWMLHHTPAHALAIPFGIDDQLARYRLLTDAMGFGTGVFARPGRLDDENLRFIAAEPTISSVILPLPTHVQQLSAAMNAIANPMPPDQREAQWNDYRRRIPEPPKPGRDVPLE